MFKNFLVALIVAASLAAAGAMAQIGRAVSEPNLKVNWHAGSVNERLQMVASGRTDLECANTTQTQSRLANVDFSNLIFIDAGGFLVKAGIELLRG